MKKIIKKGKKIFPPLGSFLTIFGGLFTGKDD